MTDFSIPLPSPKESWISRRFGSVVHTQVCVMYAVMLHDIKARFFGNGLGYIVTILWPGAHIALIVIIHAGKSKTIPYGESAVLYAATGAVTYIIWSYLAKFTMRSVNRNAQFRQYPIVKLLDIIISRQILELVSCTIIIYGLIIIFYLLGIDFVPSHRGDAVLGLLATAALGLGFGMINGQICAIFPLWALIYIGIQIPMYLTSGAILINPEFFPDKYAQLFSWNPLLHCVEWIRSAYYVDYPTHLLSKSYVLYLSFITYTVGLIMDRVARLF